MSCAESQELYSRGPLLKGDGKNLDNRKNVVTEGLTGLTGRFQSLPRRNYLREDIVLGMRYRCLLGPQYSGPSCSNVYF